MTQRPHQDHPVTPGCPVGFSSGDAEAIGQRLRQVERRLQEGETQFEALHQQVTALNHSITTISGDIHAIKEVVIAFTNAKGFLATAKALWAVLKIAGVAGGVLWAVWYFGKTGIWRLP